MPLSKPGGLSYGDVGVTYPVREEVPCPLPSSNAAAHRAGAQAADHRQAAPGILIALWLFVTSRSPRWSPPCRSMWGWGLSWTDVVLFVVFYSIGGFGIGVGFHRYFTHGSFKAKRWLRVALSLAGSLAIEGSPTQWVADHRRHHEFTDMEGDPHSPWRYGESLLGPDQGPVLRPRRLAVPPRAVQPGALRPRPAGRQGHPAGRPAVPPPGRLLGGRTGRSSAAWSPGPGRAR